MDEHERHRQHVDVHVSLDIGPGLERFLSNVFEPAPLSPRLRRAIAKVARGARAIDDLNPDKPKGE